MLNLDFKKTVCAAVLGAAVVGAMGAAVPAKAAGLMPVEEKRRCDLSGTMALTTDYVFRGISLSDEGPAIQGSVDLTCGIFYTGAWASSLDLSNGPNIEIDYYAGITPSVGGFDFDLGILYYTYPHSNSDLDYPELKFGVSKGITDNITLGVTYYHAFLADDTDTNTVEGSWEFGLPKVSIFSPKLSGVVGYEDNDDTGFDYTYWSVGLSADFHERWTVDVRYWDTSEDTDNFDERVVGTISASF